MGGSTLRCFEEGHSLVGAMVAVLMIGMGAAGLARWTIELMVVARTQLQQEWAISLLQDRLELGASATPQESIELEGTPYHLEHVASHSGAATADTPSVDPVCGAHADHRVRWTDAKGQARALSLRSYHCMRARAY